MTPDHDRRLALAAARALGVTAGYWLPSTALVLPPVRSLLRVRATVDCADAVALTFDDGPHAEGTPAVLAQLERLGARATFFLVGEQVARRPALAAEVAAAGHGVGVHCHRHRNLMRLTPRQVRDDLRRAADTIARATGAEPRHYRPPYGILTLAALAVARAEGWEIVLWRRDGHDWRARATPVSIAARVLRGLRPQDVVLLHDADHYAASGSWRRTAAALGPLVAGLAERRLEAVPLDPVG